MDTWLKIIIIYSDLHNYNIKNKEDTSLHVSILERHRPQLLPSHGKMYASQQSDSWRKRIAGLGKELGPLDLAV
jgi:hypothetical protein